MTVDLLIEKLKKFPQDLEVMCQDCVGYRDAVGPYMNKITEQDASDNGHCEGRVDEKIVVL